MHLRFRPKQIALRPDHQLQQLRCHVCHQQSQVMARWKSVSKQILLSNSAIGIEQIWVVDNRLGWEVLHGSKWLSGRVVVDLEGRGIYRACVPYLMTVLSSHQDGARTKPHCTFNFFRRSSSWTLPDPKVSLFQTHCQLFLSSQWQSESGQLGSEKKNLESIIFGFKEFFFGSKMLGKKNVGTKIILVQK